MVKNLPVSAGDLRYAGLIPGSRRSPGGGGHSNPLQYSCLENSMDRVPWWAKVHVVAKSQIQLKQLSTLASFQDKKKENNKVNSWVLTIVQNYFMV